jgi:hypothetical protein
MNIKLAQKKCHELKNFVDNKINSFIIRVISS